MASDLHSVYPLSARTSTAAHWTNAGGTGNNTDYDSAASRQPDSGEGGTERMLQIYNASGWFRLYDFPEGGLSEGLVIIDQNILGTNIDSNGRFELLASDGTVIFRVDPVTAGSSPTVAEGWSGDTLVSRGTTDETLQAGAGWGEWVGIVFKIGAAGEFSVGIGGVYKTLVDSAATGVTKNVAAVGVDSLTYSGLQDTNVGGIYVFASRTAQDGGTVLPFLGAFAEPDAESEDTNWVDELGNGSGSSDFPAKVASSSGVSTSTFVKTSTTAALLLMEVDQSGIWPTETPGTRLGVMVSGVVEAIGGAGGVRPAWKYGGTTIYGDEISLSSGAAQVVSWTWDEKPGGGDPTADSIDSGTFGFEATTVPTDIRVYSLQVYVPNDERSSGTDTGIIFQGQGLAARLGLQGRGDSSGGGLQGHTLRRVG